jgi:hypothetical protein
VKALFSDAADVVLANPFGPAVCGWSKVGDALDFAASRFRNGDVTAFDRVTSYVAAELAVIHETESWSEGGGAAGSWRH